MPSVSRPSVVQRAAEVKVAQSLSSFLGVDDILATGVAAVNLSSSKMNVALYGRNGVGKTTLACQGEGPIALLAIDPSPGGGARSINRPDVVVYTVAAGFLPDKDGKVESLKGSEKIMALVGAMRSRQSFPFKKLVVDGLSSWNEIILSEILGVNYESMPAVLTSGKVSTEQYVERVERMVRYLRPIVDLPCDVWLLAQEKDHNPPRDEKDRVKGSKLMREQMAAQEGSFFSLALSDEPTRWVQNACDFIMQLYEENEYAEERLPNVVMNGQTFPGGVQVVPTGRRVKRLRCQYHPNYATRLRSPNYNNVPEYIEAPTPEERYTAFIEVAAGKRTKWGKYLV